MCHGVPRTGVSADRGSTSSTSRSSAAFTRVSPPVPLTLKATGPNGVQPSFIFAHFLPSVHPSFHILPVPRDTGPQRVNTSFNGYTNPRTCSAFPNCSLSVYLHVSGCPGLAGQSSAYLSHLHSL